MTDVMFWGFAAALVLITLLALLRPVFRAAPAPAGSAEAAFAVFEDQLAEIDRDAARALLPDDQAEAARTEVKRRMLAAARRREGGRAEVHRDTRLGQGALLAAALAVPALGLAVYLGIGDPLGRDYARSEALEMRDVASLAASVRERLLADGDGPTQGWLLLGRTYTGLGDLEAAADAYARLADRPDVTGETLSLYGEVLVLSAGGVVTPQAKAVLDRAIALGGDARAYLYRATGLAQQDQRDAAIALLEDGLATLGPNAALSAELTRLRTTPARNPQPEDIAAADAMTEADREAFIRSMVSGLAARLDAEPDDLDGWLRLARAYVVLGETPNARNALEEAASRMDGLADDDPRRAFVLDGLAALGDGADD